VLGADLGIFRNQGALNCRRVHSCPLHRLTGIGNQWLEVRRSAAVRLESYLQSLPPARGYEVAAGGVGRLARGSEFWAEGAPSHVRRKGSAFVVVSDPGIAELGE